jgi:hypothetical protein
MRPRAFILRCSLLLFFSLRFFAAADDIKLADGTVLRDVRVLEVRPDALIVGHRNGVAMADFEKLPKQIRVRYGYDPRKAASFREREAATRRADAEENRRLVAAYKERKMAIARSRMEAGDAEVLSFSGFNGSRLDYRASAADRSYEAGVAYVGKEIAQAEEARIIAARKADTFWNAPFWQHPVVQVIGALLSGGVRIEF